MHGQQRIRELFIGYGETVDTSLQTLFASMPAYDLYKHLAYFMGFADGNLEPVHLYGGKRFRSSLCLMLADWLGNKTGALPVATSIELFHNFTLIHDDIVDEDTLRRGRKTVWSMWGVPHAINSGDGQALLAMELLTEAPELDPSTLLRVQQFLLGQYRKVVEGQYLDFTLTGTALSESSVTEEAYFEMIERKTAALIAAATKSAGMVAGVSTEAEQALYEYGRTLGIAYQLCDDTVSIWGTSEQTGKCEQGDVLERKKTLPVLYAHRELEGSQRAKLLGHYTSTGEMPEEAVQDVVALLDACGTYDHMTGLVTTYAKSAKEAADALPLRDTEKETLWDIVDALLPDIKKQS